MEGDISDSCSWCAASLYFYPRPHMEGDRRANHHDLSGRISTHALTWRATNQIDREPQVTSISTHALTWRATIVRKCHAHRLAISTHALTWRATAVRRPESPPSATSTHALTWRATSPSAHLHVLQCDFYPRPHMEGDCASLRSVVTFSISTHALSWRATSPLRWYR